MSIGKSILASLRQQLNLTDYRKTHWEGGFEEYLDIVREHPEVTRTAYQRLYDMILSHGTEEVYENKEKLIRYKFFTEFAAKHGDAIFGLDRPLMQLVNVFKSAAKGYGTERRVLLLHGPVGSSKSTIARLLKKGLEDYSRTDEGMLLHLLLDAGAEGGAWQKCPMHEEPLHLVPLELRPALLAKLNDGPQVRRPRGHASTATCARSAGRCTTSAWPSTTATGPRCSSDVKVYRLILSRAGPHRHRHLPAQGREEPGLDRADRRHQLPQDRRVRHRQRSARLQLRRRVQHRQPRHRRVHRGAEARRGVPLRPARRLAGTQDQAEEVRADGHRRSDPRPQRLRARRRSRIASTACPAWTTLEKLYDRFVADPSGLEVLAHDFAAGRHLLDAGARPVPSSLHRQPADDLAKVGRGRDNAEPLDLRPQRRDVLSGGAARDHGRARSGRRLRAGAGVEVIDVLEGVAGFVRDRRARHRRGRQDDAALPRRLGAARSAASCHGDSGRLRPDRGRAAVEGSDYGPDLVRHRRPRQRPQRRRGHQSGEPR